MSLENNMERRKMYDSAKSVIIHLFTKEDFKPVWEKWVEACRPPGALPDFTIMKNMIFKYTNAADVFKNDEVDIYYPSVYMRLAKDEGFIAEMDSKLKLL